MKIQKLMFASAAILFGICSQSCVSAASNVFEKMENMTMGKVEEAGPMKTITIEADKVTSIDTSSGIRVEYTQGSETSVMLTAPDNIIDDVEVTVKNGELNCGMKTKRRVNKPITVTVTSPGVDDLEASSGSSIKIAAGLDMPGSEMEISVSSGARIDVNKISAESIEADASSGSALRIDGAKATTMAFSTSSGSSMRVESITAGSVTGKASSGSSMGVSGTTKYVELRASSGSSLSGRSLVAETGLLKSSSGASVSGNVKGSCEIEKSSGGSVSNRAD